MSDHVARAALERMNMREVAVAAHYTALSTDLQMLAQANPEKEKVAFLERRGEMCAAFGMDNGVQEKPFAFSNGVAIIPIQGTLINRFSYSWGFVTGYNFIRNQLNAALADSDVQGIILDVASNGGEAAGCFELSAEIAAARDQKPILAVVDSNCYSAGYALASAASKIVSIPSGGVGSVGVVAMHVDQSAFLDKIGIKVTLIYEAAHKVDGNPFQALPEAVLADFQAGIHKSYEAFVSLVATNRGLDAQVVRDTQSRTYRADEALALGLIDAISTPIEAAKAFLGELSGSNFQLRQGASMSTAQQEPGAATQAQAKTNEQAAAEARQAERARVSDIMGCAEAKGREALANHFAMHTDMTVEQAQAALAVAPKTEAEAKPATAGANPFQQAMDNSQNPNVGADSTSGVDHNAAASDEDKAARILGNQAKATGVKAK